MEKLISKGAEADLYLSEWYGSSAVLKIRKPKPYRVPRLDQELRRQRTVREAAFMIEAKRAGVATPLVYFVDDRKAEIVMQFIEGRRFRELLKDNQSSPEIFSRLGQSIANLHLSQIMHGDLTTSNFILSNHNRVVFLDFGLTFYSNRIEDMAVDLHLIKQVLNSAHSDVSTQVFRSVMKGYERRAGKDHVAQIEVKVREIERRARYTRVD